MAYRNYCPHLDATDASIAKITGCKELQKCEDCENRGSDLWLCLQPDCLKIGCSYNVEDHGTKHNQANPSHYTQMNLSTNRIWCYGCNSEVFLTRRDSESEGDTEDARSFESNFFKAVHNPPKKKLPKGFDLDAMITDGSDSSDNEENGYNDSHVNGRTMGLVGLQNIGNTCYMNAALQALSNTVPLTRFFLECGVTVQVVSEGKKPGLSRTYQTLVKDIWTKKNGGFVTPSGILYGIRNVHSMFRGYHQHDTQEFLRNFMDQLHEELKQPTTSEQSPETENFMLALEAPPTSYDSSEGEYETCDSGVSERSSLSDDGERSVNSALVSRRRASSPRRTKARHPPVEAPPRKQPRLRSVISEVFDGKLLSSVQCLTCDRVSSRVETFQDLSLPIPSREHLVMLHGRSSTTELPNTQEGWMAWLLSWFRSWLYGPTITLHDCLAAFFSTDELKGDNMYSCEKCNKLRNGVKFSKVLQLPEVLCIHLKRFRHELMFSSKISSAVHFPLKGLDMKPYLHTDCTSQVTSYDLTSVICHHGTAGGGHYTCLALNNDQWYEFDDQCVTKVSPEVVQNCEAYVLFYTKATNPLQLDNLRKQEAILKKPFSTADRVFISKQWMVRLETCAEPGPIDNSDFLCIHNNLNPERARLLNRLAVSVGKKAYDSLYKMYGGAPYTSSLLPCPTCLALQRRILLEAETILQLGRINNQVATHVLAISWFSQWQDFVQHRTSEPPGPIDNSRVLQLEDPNEYAEVSEEVWNFFYNIYGGGPEIRLKPKAVLYEDEETNLSAPEDDPLDDTTLKFCIPPSKKPNNDKGAINTSLYCNNDKGAINPSLYCKGEPLEPEAGEEEAPKPSETIHCNSDIDNNVSSASNNSHSEAPVKIHRRLRRRAVD